MGQFTDSILAQSCNLKQLSLFLCNCSPPPLIIISGAQDRTKWDRADVKMERNKGMVLNGAEQKTQSNGGQPFTDVIEQGRAERSRADTPTLSEVVLFRALGLPLFIRLGSLEPYGRL